MNLRRIIGVGLAALVTTTVSARYIQADPIGFAGGMNLFLYADGAPLTRTDPMGLATDMCTRRLTNMPVRAGPLFHQFICVPDGRGGKICGGLSPVGRNFFDTAGKMEYEQSTASATCDQVVEDNACVEQCIAQEMTKTPSHYSINLTKGDNCQTWANATLHNCKLQCRRRN